MAANVQVFNTENGRSAKVTKSGELVVAPLYYSDTQFREMDLDDTAYNFYQPLPFKQFVITGIVAFADRSVADNTETIVEIYEAATSTATTVSKTLIQFGMGQLTSISIVPINILVNPAVWINAKTGDDDIFLTIMGYYIDKLE